jgi:small subunit ribosomal protein S12
MTVRYWLKNKLRLRLPKKSKSPMLEGNPQKSATIIKCFDTTPRKPNSAKRKMAKVSLFSTVRKKLRYTRVYFEGMGLNRFQPYTSILMRGRGPRDLPGVRYTAIRGARLGRYGVPPLENYRRARSKYGVKKYLGMDAHSKKEMHQKARQDLWPTTHPKYRLRIKKDRRRFLLFKHLAFLKFKTKRRRFWLAKARLP